MTATEGTYPGTIPTDTIVPHWAYVPPSTTGDRFNVSVAKLAGDFPESSQVSSTPTSSSSSTTLTSSFGYSTTTSISTSTPTTSSSASPTSTTGGGGGKSSTNVGAIAGGVAGGVLGLALISFLGFLLLRNKKPKNDTDVAGAGAGAGAYDPAAAGAGAAAGGVPKPTPEMAQYSVASPTSPISGSTQLPYTQSHLTGQTQGAPYQATIASGGYYNPSDPAQATPAPQGYPAPQAPYYNEPYNAGGRYSGMPEV